MALPVRVGGFAAVALVVAVLYATVIGRNPNGWSKEEVLGAFRSLSDRLGLWAIPLYVGVHTLSISLCLPYAVFLEAGASLLFGFFSGILCVFFAKILGASLSFWVGRIVFRSSSSAVEWAQRSKYFHLLARGVGRDGWRFVLLARFSPIPSYIINYGLAATDVHFFIDFLLPTVIGCVPMILQNTSVGSLAGAAISSTSRSQKSQILSYSLPFLGIVSSIVISLRIKKYSSMITAVEDDKSSKEDLSPTDDKNSVN
ncbi:unnamed protein product [Victoria cruziana]